MELQENEPKVYNKFQWFLFAGVIPFLFAVTFALVVLTIAGVNVMDVVKKYGQHIPGISALSKSDEPEINIEEKLRKDIGDLEANATGQIATVTKLEKEAEQNLQELQNQQAQIDKLTEELIKKDALQQDTKQTLKDIATMYESMSAQNAAAILTELNDQEALKIVQSLSMEALGAIFEKMSPADAAKFTEHLTKEASSK
ncbi:MotE family protein [Bacillus sp. DJP31]|uniref:MotE family protein n=1 Tax=Bacillus sp. DJP31 TaxID=3409789 RepID=UPI003BB7EE48